MASYNALERLRSHVQHTFSMPSPALPDDPLWYKDAIIYETHVKAFFDSNNDGIGDFTGLTNKLDYLQQLGVTCIWLLPFFPFAAARRRIRYRGLPRRAPELWNAGRFSRVPGRGPRARSAGADRAGHQPHLAISTPGFRRRAMRRRDRRSATYYVWSDTDQQVRGRAHHLHRHGEIQLVLGSRRRRPTTGTGSSRTSRI